MRVMCDPNHILLMNCQSSLQFASDCAETVEHKVLPYTVDPFTTGREGTANKVTSFSLTRAEASDNLSLHVHDDHCVRSVANHKVFWVFRKKDHAVNSDVGPCSAAQGFKGIGTFCGFHVPDLYSAIRRCTNNIVPILCKRCFVNKGGMATKLLQGFPDFKP